MFKLLLSTALLSLALAAPSEVNIIGPAVTTYAAAPVAVQSALVAEPTHVQVHEPTLAKVGDVVESVPTAVSHQSSTIVHSKAQRVTPIVAPAVRSYSAPALRTYSAPLVEHQQYLAASPFLRSLPLGLGPAAAFVHANAPVQVRTYAAPGAAYNTYAFTYGSPYVYAAPAFKK